VAFVVIPEESERRRARRIPSDVVNNRAKVILGNNSVDLPIPNDPVAYSAINRLA